MVCSFELCCMTRVGEVTKFCPPLKLRVFVDDITALFMVKNKEVTKMAKKKVMRKL